ncbi:NAD(P)H-dependent oxidoreductase [Parasphingorhabdus sp. JC815]|uniref:NADPH-dependent FMN reductase n=1 Tax=Parasphingorhabdus sp. JC815 TaxID=3232140 RepID=UPI00345B2F20
MSKNYKIAVIVGSLREESVNRKSAKALGRLAADNLEFNFIEIGDLPLYNEDIDTADAPAPWKRFRKIVSQADAVLFVTPEYNRSVPGVLKNAIDVGSRPYGQSVWEKKPAAIMSVSPGNIGGFGANHHLRQSLVFLDMPILQQPEAYVGGAYDMFDEKGEFQTDRSRDFFQKFIDAFGAWIERFEQ